MPDCPRRAAMKSAICRGAERFGWKARAMFGRSKPCTKMRGSPSNSRATMSSRVISSAVAVSASSGGEPSRLAQLAELQIVGAEIVPPLRDAMRLVDGEAASGRCVEQAALQPGRGEPLRRGIEEPQLAGLGRSIERRHVLLVRIGAEESDAAATPSAAHRRHLVAHQRDRAARRRASGRPATIAGSW